MRTKLLSILRSLGKTGKPDRVDTTTRVALDADFSDRGETSSEPELARKVDPIGELMRIVVEEEKDPPPRRAKAPTYSNRLRRTKRRR